MVLFNTYVNSCPLERHPSMQLNALFILEMVTPETYHRRVFYLHFVKRLISNLLCHYSEVH